MKKIILFVILAVTLASCVVDKNKSSKFVTTWEIVYPDTVMRYTDTFYGVRPEVYSDRGSNYIYYKQYYGRSLYTTSSTCPIRIISINKIDGTE